MSDAVIIATARTPIGRARKGTLAGMDAFQLAEVVQIVPVLVPQADGGSKIFDTDEHPRRNATLEVLATLPVLHPELPEATVTAGNLAIPLGVVPHMVWG